MNTPGLQQLVDDGVVDEVLQQIKSGKEADVFLVRKGDAYLAAKVYKERSERNFKNNAGYLEGRNIRSSRDARAMAKGSRYGRAQQEQAWKSAEVDALYKLSAAGVRVPAPDIFYEGVLVMALVIDAEGQPAPRLSDVTVDAEQAMSLYRELLRQVSIILSCDLIHGDLSPFNVLLAHDGPTIIDMPQVVSAAGNPQAEMFFRRDVQNLHRFLAQFAPALNGRPDGGADLWKRYSRQELYAGYVPDLATLTDDSPIPTFKARQGNRPGGRGRGRGPGASPQPSGQPPRAQQPGPRPQGHGGNPSQANTPRPQGQHGGRPQQTNAPRPQGQHGGRPQQQPNAPRSQGQHGGRPHQQPNAPRSQGQHGGRPPQQPNAPRPQGQHGGRPQQQPNAPRPQGQHGGRPQQPPNAQRPQGQNPGRPQHPNAQRPQAPRPQVTHVQHLGRNAGHASPPRGGPGAVNHFRPQGAPPAPGQVPPQGESEDARPGHRSHRRRRHHRPPQG